MAVKSAVGLNNKIFMRNYAADRMGHKIDGKIDDISDMEYNRISNDYLEDLGDELDLISEDHTDMDFDLSQGVLTLNTKNGTYVINRQPPNKQIWLSSPISGPNRYDLINGKWASLRDNGRLTDLLSHELSQTYNDTIELQLEN
ncbi:frataxin homolog, mitochondrial [[Candida] jaroonii]|uniref:Frataxin homolog, mitochondrial n=1 Tax=[Candida] jaroonii TaxID=467808 RepID=A0ACA9Y3G1_9ASCO|nr:frataxin homolog, mitochondrial [[Candida] jaroonii]